MLTYLFSDDTDSDDIGYNEPLDHNETSICDSESNGGTVNVATRVLAAPVFDYDESMPSTSDDDDQTPLQQAPNRGWPRTRGRPPDRRRRSITPPHQWAEQYTDKVLKRFTGPQPGPRNDYTRKSGYVLNAELYEGKTSGEAQNPHNVDKNIVQPYRGQGSIIFMNNFYMSVPLLNSLYSDGFITMRISYNSIFKIDWW